MASFVISPTKNPDSVLPIYVDFASQLAASEALTAIVTTSVVFTGTDAAPEAILSGSPTITQNVAMQVLTGGLPGVVYLVGFDATTNLSNHIIIYTYIAVIDTNPFIE